MIRAALLLVLASGFSLEATVYHVRKDGTGDCTTINGCVERLKPGDTLFVHSGTYNESVGPGIPNGTSDALRVTIKAAPSEKVSIQAPNKQHTILFGSSVPQSYITIQGFTLLANGENVVKTYGKSSEFPPPAGALEDAWSSHIRIIDNEVTGAGSQGVGTTGCAVVAGEHLEFINNNVHGNGYIDETCSYHGWNILYIGGGNNLFEHNWIHDNYGTGLAFWQSPNSRVSNNIARYNRIHNNTQIRPCSAPNGGGIFVAGQYQAHDSCLIYNNLVYANDNGIWLGFGNYTGGKGSRIYNNTVFGNTEFGGIVITSQTAIDVRNNISIGNRITQTFQWGPEPSGANDIYVHNSTGTFDRNLCSVPGFGVTVTTTSNPKFASLPDFDFHLLSGSSAIDAGSSISAVKNDFEGTSRPQGTAYDIGAYEFAPASSFGILDNTASLASRQIRIRPTGTGIVISGQEGSKASVTIYSNDGRKLAAFENVGSNGVLWSPAKSSAGIYLVKLVSGSITRTARMFSGE